MNNTYKLTYTVKRFVNSLLDIANHQDDFNISECAYQLADLICNHMFDHGFTMTKNETSGVVNNIIKKD